jgi:hypothetical protein
MEGESMRMPTYWMGQQIQAGDWVRVYSNRYGVWHHGIVRRLVFVPGGIGVEIIHNTKGGNVAVVDWYEFAAGNPVLLHRRPESAAHAAAVAARAEANIGKPYYVFAQNCEHFASFAFTGQAESETVKAAGWMVVGVLAVAALTAD